MRSTGDGWGATLRRAAFIMTRICAAGGIAPYPIRFMT
jgi:hypothetical protein